MKRQGRDMSFAKWLKERRLDARLTQREAAERARMTRAMWAKLEAGDSGTRRSNIPRIAQALGTDLNETYRQAGFAPPITEDERSGRYILTNTRTGEVSVSTDGDRFTTLPPELAQILIEMREEQQRAFAQIQEQIKELARQLKSKDEG